MGPGDRGNKRARRRQPHPANQGRELGWTVMLHGAVVLQQSKRVGAAASLHVYRASKAPCRKKCLESSWAIAMVPGLTANLPT